MRDPPEIMNSEHPDPNSAFSSTKFSTSHATLVGKDNELVDNDTYETLTSEPQKYTWLDHLRVMFCVKWPKVSKTHEEPEVCQRLSMSFHSLSLIKMFWINFYLTFVKQCFTDLQSSEIRCTLNMADVTM
jgi:hypothetical protein